jgi:hypothetical protein
VTVIDATNAGAIAAANAPFTLAMALQGQTILGNNNADDGEVFAALPPLAWQQFTSYRQVNDADWVGYDGMPYKTGQKFKYWNGVKWMRLPNEYFPVYSANVVDFFMWNKRSLGAIDNYNLRSTVTWENLYSGWYHNNRFAAAITTLLAPGIVRFRYGATSSITIN